MAATVTFVTLGIVGGLPIILAFFILGIAYFKIAKVNPLHFMYPLETYSSLCQGLWPSFPRYTADRLVVLFRPKIV